MYNELKVATVGQKVDLTYDAEVFCSLSHMCIITAPGPGYLTVEDSACPCGVIYSEYPAQGHISIAYLSYFLFFYSIWVTALKFYRI